MLYYAGIGSRETPKEFLNLFTRVAKYLSTKSCVLRSGGARRLQARNSHQILGWDLNSHSDFVICWTKGGKGNGGTGQAIRIAKDYNIPVFDCGNFRDVKECAIELKKFLDKILEEK